MIDVTNIEIPGLDKVYEAYRKWQLEDKGYATCATFQDFKNIFIFIAVWKAIANGELGYSKGG